MEAKELRELSNGAVDAWIEVVKQYDKNKPRFVKKKDREPEQLTEGGRLQTKEQKAKACGRVLKHVSQGHGIMLSTNSDLHLRCVPAVWPGESALKNSPGMTMVVCNDGKAMLYYDGRKIVAFETEGYKMRLANELEATRQYYLVDLGATNDEANEGCKRLIESNRNLDTEFGTPNFVIEGVTDDSTLDPDTQAMMKENAETAYFASGVWASTLDTQAENHRMVRKSARNGISRIATKSHRAKQIKAFADEIAKVLNGGQSVIYSTDPEINDREAKSYVEDARKAMTDSKTVSMAVERGKVTLFGNSEKVVYISNEREARELAGKDESSL